MSTPEPTLEEQFAERFKKLPKVVQNAITSADVQKRMRTLAEEHKLHIDQWSVLETEVRLALYGFQRVEDLPKNLQSELGIDESVAQTLAADISNIVFKPIREELERELEHPEAKAASTTGVEDMRTRELSDAAGPPMSGPAAAASPAVAPATPPTAPPTDKIVRAPISAAYKAGEASTARKSIEDDPYRESPT